MPKSEPAAESTTSLPPNASFYDELPLWSAPFGQMLLDLIPLRRAMTVVDLGAGTGFLTTELAQRCGPDSQIVAVDPWWQAMDVLRDKCTFLGLMNVKFSETDAASFDQENGTVDLVVSNLGINNFDDAIGVMRNARRMLRPDGQLVFTTNLAGHMAEFYDAYRDTLAELGKSTAISDLDDEISRRGTVESITEALRTAGMKVSEVVTDEFKMRFADGTSLLGHHFIKLAFLPAWRRLIAPNDLEQVFTRLEQMLNERADTEGGLSLTIPTACFVAVRTTRTATNPTADAEAPPAPSQQEEV